MKIGVIASITLALVTSLWTWWPRQTQAARNEVPAKPLMNASGQSVDPEKVAFLQVATPEVETGAVKVFEVSKKADNWVIPSHHNYPADGGSRVGNTAGAVLNVPRGPLVSSDPKRHAELGVEDPSQATSSREGRGKRVTLKDAGGAVLVDLIIGKKAPQADVYFVREASSNDVHTAKVNPEISTSFRDWVETDLLKVSAADIRGITIRDYSVDARQGLITPRSETILSKGKDATAWTSPATPEGKVVNQEAVQKVVNELTGLRLAGVRPYDQRWLEKRGFYFGPNNQLYGTEGQLEIVAKDGLKYHLFFGSGAVGDDLDTSAELKSDKPATTQSRYMAVFMAYDEKADETLPPADVKEHAPALKKEPAGKQRAIKAQRRFSRFFYVISDDSFKKLRPAIDELFKAEEKKPEDKKDEKKESTGDASKAGDAQSAAPAPAATAPSAPAATAPSAPEGTAQPAATPDASTQSPSTPAQPAAVPNTPPSPPAQAPQPAPAAPRATGEQK